ncbi:MAG TPA: hypothetical protein VIG78_02125 [Gemmatimonadaceae bacterium]|jgi:hypothetical protein
MDPLAELAEDWLIGVVAHPKVAITPAASAAFRREFDSEDA